MFYRLIILFVVVFFTEHVFCQKISKIDTIITDTSMAIIKNYKPNEDTTQVQTFFSKTLKNTYLLDGKKVSLGSGVSVYEDYYDNGTLRHLTIEADTSEYYSYHQNGVLKCEEKHVNYSPIDTVRCFCDNKQLIKEIIMSIPDYELKIFHCNGKVKAIGNIIEHMYNNGTWKHYSEDGELIKEEEWDMGKLIFTKEY